MSENDKLKADKKSDSQLFSNDAVLNEFRMAMSDFNKAMRSREEMAIRIGMRTTQIIRIGTGALVVLGAIMFFLIWTLMSDMNSMAHNMDKMSGNIMNMEQYFGKITEDMGAMRGDMASMNTAMSQMNVSMQTMQQDISTMNPAMQHMSHDMQQLNGSVSHISTGVHSMTKDVNEMSAPMRFFPFQ